ncbi:Protein MAIN-LIKE 2 [Glycine max]|nr:Protein MAIN-LIKE 2 [Glycine max]
MCEQYLGVVSLKGEAIVGSAIKLKWLQDNMSSLPSEPTQQQLEAHCRVYILWLIGGVLMQDKMENWVHLMYLIVLDDLDRVRRWSGGGLRHGDVINYRMRLDYMTAEQFSWNPYLHFLDALESTTFVDSSI